MLVDDERSGGSCTVVVRIFVLSAPVSVPLLSVSYAGPPMNVNA
jgi:hypothetical protein